MLFIYSLIILSLNLLMAECDQMCDCQEISIVMDALQREILERKLEYSRLLSKIQNIKARQTSVTGLGDVQGSGATDGGWTSWSSWNTCSVTCGDGITERSRSCTNPKPSENGKTCVGRTVEKRSCNIARCPLVLYWTAWRGWGACSVTCGDGVRQRSRSCLNSLLVLSSDCEGESVDNESCNNARCPLDGGWTNWSSWGSCSVTCGGGIRQRSRSCTNPRPSGNGRECNGVTVRKRRCNFMPCPVDGGWTSWSSWGTCSVTCDGGIRERSRSCTNPRPSKNGRKCEGNTEEKGSCNVERCQIDGGWTNWSSWGTCSVTCGSGIRERSRSCTNPRPSENGRECKGGREERGSCNTALCPIDGGWTEWSSWGTCSVTCDYGVRERSRSCTNPRPSENGRQCKGFSEDKEICNIVRCSVDGGWTHWSSWGSCSVTCGYGSRKRTRSCTNPRPKGSGKQCSGRSVTEGSCAYNPCAEKQCLSGRACSHCPPGLVINGVNYCCPKVCNVYGPLKMTDAGTFCTCN